MTHEVNPLAQYFRVPGIHVRLPSGGRYSNIDPSNLSMTGEIPVYPMTLADELLIKNPDALLNGFAVEQLILSCVPAIKDVRTVPAVDVDVLLLAIKYSSYGDDFEVGTKCPSCKHEMDFSVSIQNELLAHAVAMEDEYVVRINDDLVAYLRPYNYEAQTKLNLAAFEEAKLFQALLNREFTEEEKMDQFNHSFVKISGLNLDYLANCVIKIVSPQGEIWDPAFIREFIKNAEKNLIQKIQDGMKAFEHVGIDKMARAKCEKCEHEWQTEYSFDPSHFFASGSSGQSQKKSPESSNDSIKTETTSTSQSSELDSTLEEVTPEIKSGPPVIKNENT